MACVDQACAASAPAWFRTHANLTAAARDDAHHTQASTCTVWPSVEAVDEGWATRGEAAQSQLRTRTPHTLAPLALCGERDTAVDHEPGVGGTLCASIGLCAPICQPRFQWSLLGMTVFGVPQRQPCLGEPSSVVADPQAGTRITTFAIYETPDSATMWTMTEHPKAEPVRTRTSVGGARSGAFWFVEVEPPDGDATRNLTVTATFHCSDGTNRTATQRYGDANGRMAFPGDPPCGFGTDDYTAGAVGLTLRASDAEARAVDTGAWTVLAAQWRGYADQAAWTRDGAPSWPPTGFCACEAPSVCERGECRTRSGAALVDATDVRAGKRLVEDGCLPDPNGAQQTLCAWNDRPASITNVRQQDQGVMERLDAQRNDRCDGSPWCMHRVGTSSCRSPTLERAKAVCCRTAVVNEAERSRCAAESRTGECLTPHGTTATLSWTAAACERLMPEPDDGGEPWRLCSAAELRRCGAAAERCGAEDAWTDEVCNFQDVCVAEGAEDRCGASYAVRLDRTSPASAPQTVQFCASTDGGCRPRSNRPRFYGDGGNGAYNVYTVTALDVLRNQTEPLPADHPLQAGYPALDPRLTEPVFFTANNPNLRLCPVCDAAPCPACSCVRNQSWTWSDRSPDGKRRLLRLVALADGWFRYEGARFEHPASALLWADCDRNGRQYPRLDACAEERQRSQAMLRTLTSPDDAPAAVAAAPTPRRGNRSAPATLYFVVDSGVDTNHSEFEAHRTLPGYRAPLDLDGAPSSDTRDPNGHGTHVAAILLGRTVGVDPDGLLVPVRVTGDDDRITLFAVQAALAWIAASVDARNQTNETYVVNLSLNFRNQQPDEALQAQLDALAARSVVVVAAAGNGGDRASLHGLPNYRGPIVVSALDGGEDDEPILAFFSSYGAPDVVDVSADGVDVRSARSGTQAGFVAKSGTSQATPFVAAALGRRFAEWRGPSYDRNLLRFMEACVERDADLGVDPDHFELVDPERHSSTVLTPATLDACGPSPRTTNQTKPSPSERVNPGSLSNTNSTASSAGTKGTPATASSTGLIVGLVAGGVAVGALGLYLWYRRTPAPRLKIGIRLHQLERNHPLHRRLHGSRRQAHRPDAAWGLGGSRHEP